MVSREGLVALDDCGHGTLDSVLDLAEEQLHAALDEIELLLELEPGHPNRPVM